ncbi:hypothetical protein [Actinophytocola sediminis]
MDEVRPPGEPSAADVVEFAEERGFELNDWQRQAIRALYDGQPSGRIAFRRERAIVSSIPRATLGSDRVILDEITKWAELLPDEPATARPVELTRAEFDALRASNPPIGRPWSPALNVLAGLPIVLVCARPGCRKRLVDWLDREYCSVEHREAATACMPFRGFTAHLVIVDELAEFGAAPPSRRGWLRRAIGRVIR